MASETARSSTPDKRRLFRVQDLIAALQAFPPDMQVVFSYETGCCEFDGVPTLAVVTQAENGYVYPEPRVEVDLD